ncbi:MAG: phage major capsid protein [Bacteroidales bacterium]|nr:phage major capsid protein [Candidatus Scybalousia scybalohippi]
MGDILSKGTLFPAELSNQVISMVKGKSAIAALANAEPIAFNGNEYFTFTLDKEADIVAENGAKTKGGATITPVTIKPIKIEYGARISDEFMYASEEKRIDMLAPLADGFSKKFARALDIMSIHGKNPRTKQLAEGTIGNNYFDYVVEQVVTQDEQTTADDQVEAAIALVEGSDGEVSGMAMAPAFKSDLAAMKGTDGHKIYPELAWGKAPGSINGLPVTTNNTVAFDSSTDKALVGDFENMFKWGYAKDMWLKVIEYGNPDNDQDLGDLQGHNQVYVRAEAYLGWGILDANSFAFIKSAEISG